MKTRFFSYLWRLMFLLTCLTCSQLASALTLTSPGFADQDSLPPRFTCDGKNISPPLAWSDPLPKTQSYTLIIDDPDAPSGIWTHWMVFNIPAKQHALAEGVKVLPKPIQVGANSWQHDRYDGPCPPQGTHFYSFKLYALDTFLNLNRGASRTALLQAMEGHILESTELIGAYARK